MDSSSYTTYLAKAKQNTVTTAQLATAQLATAQLAGLHSTKDKMAMNSSFAQVNSRYFMVQFYTSAVLPGLRIYPYFTDI